MDELWLLQKRPVFQILFSGFYQLNFQSSGAISFVISSVFRIRVDKQNSPGSTTGFVIIAACQVGAPSTVLPNHPQTCTLLYELHARISFESLGS